MILQDKFVGNELWLSDGDCSLCRRNKYCKTPCKPNLNRRALAKQSVMVKVMYSTMTGAMKYRDGVDEICAGVLKDDKTYNT